MPIPSLGTFIEKARSSLSRQSRDRSKLLAMMPKGAVCAEVGVWKGDFSERILRETEPTTLYLIDPWKFQDEFPERMYGGSVARSQQDMDAIFEGVKARLAGWNSVRFVRDFSSNALRALEDASLDWIYIDGNHYYEYALEDLQLARAKIKPGGYIAGDDYLWGEKDGFPIQRAVAEFAREHGLEGAVTVEGTQFAIRR